MTLRKGWLRHRDFIALDLLVFELSVLAADFLTARFFGGTFLRFWQMYLLVPVLFTVVSIMMDAYNGVLQRGYLKEALSLLKTDAVTLAILFVIFYLLQMMADLPRPFLLLCVAFQIPFTMLMRFQHKFYLSKRYSKVKYARQIVVIATEKTAREMVNTISASAIRNYQFFGLILTDRSMVGEKIGNVVVSSDKDGMIDYIQRQIVDEVLINLPDDSAQTLAIARKLLDMGITVHIFMENSFQTLPNRTITNVFGYNVLSTTISPVTFRQSLLKRVIDIAGGLVGCLVTLLLILIIGPMIFIASPGPIFFAQTRVGKKGREFKIYKFRSMYMDAEERKKELMAQNKMKDGMMFKMDNDPRIIKGIGHFIRKTSLDEFPQFWNVLKGDMSLVGTRPPTVDEYRRYSPHHKRRLCMLPGITGLWQTSGRSNIIDFEEVVRLDTEYIENWTLSFDIKILFKTVMKIFRNDDGEAS